MKLRQLASTLIVCMIAVGCGSNAMNTPSPTPESASKPNTAENTRPDTTEMPPSDYEVADVFTELRKQALELEPNAIELTGVDQSGVIAVLMETGYPEAVATLVAVIDGTASLYLSNGGGIIGGGEHQPVRDVAKSFITMAHDYVSKGSAATTYPLPRKEHVRFYIVTASAIYTVEALEGDLGNERHVFSPLFHKGHELITSIREHTSE